MVQKVIPYTKTIAGMWRSTHSISHLVRKPLVLVKNKLLALLWKVTLFFNHSILIIWHFGHFFFTKIFLNVTRYRVVAVGLPFWSLSMWVFFWFVFIFLFQKFLKKKGQHSGCWQPPRIFFTLSRDSLIWSFCLFSEAKRNQFFESVHPQVTTKGK